MSMIGVGRRIERLMMGDGAVCMTCHISGLVFWEIQYVFEI